MRLVYLQQEADSQQLRHTKLRLEVAKLESPARVVATAQQLGMVSPTTITYLTAGSQDAPPSGATTPAVLLTPATQAPATQAPATVRTPATAGGPSR
ncbi:MAG: hypothetical protein NVS3B21_21340 [Acidimicrobiales bacterium]